MQQGKRKRRDTGTHKHIVLKVDAYLSSNQGEYLTIFTWRVGPMEVDRYLARAHFVYYIGKRDRESSTPRD